MQNFKAIYILFLFLFCLAYSHSEENTSNDSWAISYIESKLSSYNRTVKLEGVSGILNSKVNIAKITISDDKGIWLTAQNLTLVWDRGKLFSDTLKINKLSIKSINILRKSTNNNSLLSRIISLNNINLKSLPINIIINKLKINNIYYAKNVYGIEEHLSADGFFKFENYNLNSVLQIKGIDKQDKAFLNIHYNNKIDKLNLDFHISEKKGGLVATLLNIKNNPPIHLNIEGEGKLSNLQLRLKSNIGNMQALHGFFTINKADIIASSKDPIYDTGRNISFRLEGPVRELMPQTYKNLFSKYSSISANATILPNHTIRIDDCTMKGSALRAHGSAVILPDGFLRSLFVKANLVNYSLPKEPTLGRLEILYGDNDTNQWHADLQLNNSKRSLVTNMHLSGIAENLDTPSERHVTLNLNGFVKQSTNLIKIDSNAELMASAPILLKKLNITSNRNNVTISGMLEDKIFSGFTTLKINDLHEIGNLFKKNWSGKLNIAGQTKLSTTVISQTLNGNISNLKIGHENKLTKWLHSATKLNGNISYNISNAKKITFDNFAINNKDIILKANGHISYVDADMMMNIEKLNLNLLSEHLKGIAKGILTSKGHNGVIIAGANLSAPKILINNETFIDTNIHSAIIATDLNKFKPKFNGFLNLNSQVNSQKSNLKLVIDNRYNYKFKALNVPSSILQPFSKIKLPLIKFNAEGKLNNNILNVNINSKQNNIILNSSATYNIKTKLLKGNASGKINSELLNIWLTPKQMQTSGFINFNITSSDAVNLHGFNGNISVTNGKFYDLKHNIKLKNINILGKLNNNIIQFTKGSAQADGGGNVLLKGNINFKELKNPIANISLDLENIHYSQNLGLSAIYSGNLALKGPILNHPTLSGNILLTKAIILISRNLNAATPLEVQHKNTAKSILTTLERAHMQTIKKEPNKINNLAIDIGIKSPKHLFVKGMGLDVEMQGGAHITGDSGALNSIGNFKMVKGHLNLLSHYFDFDKGSINLNGDLKPFLSFAAHTNSDNLIITVKLEGNMDNIKISFSSSTGLPQDEILAQLLFHRSVKQLSAFQLAKIITTLSNLSGHNNFFNSIQAASTLENIDIDNDEEGNIGISAGRYITRNIYTSFGATQKGTTKATINWDLPHNFKATGQYHSDNQNNIGLYYNHDY